MSEEKWKSPSGHPISSSETDDIKMPDVVSVKELKEHLTEICKIREFGICRLLLLRKLL